MVTFDTPALISQLIVESVYGCFEPIHGPEKNITNGLLKQSIEPIQTNQYAVRVRPLGALGRESILQAPLIFFIGQVIQPTVITALSAPAIHNGSCTLPVATDI